MKVAVCVKQVPVVSMLRFDNEAGRLVREGAPSELNYFDVLAMSAVSDLKRTLPVDVSVFTMGPPQAREALVQCLATGADKAVHLVDAAFAGSDTLATARALAMALSREGFDLIVCGLNSVDAETGQVGPEIAEFLDLPQVTGVCRLEVGSSQEEITVTKLTDGGHDIVYCPLPALITVTEGVASEVYPTRQAMEAAKSKPVTEVSASDLSDDTSIFGLLGSPTWVSEIRSIEQDRDGIVVRDEPVEEAVDRLLQYLDERGVFDEKTTSRASVTRRGPRRQPGPKGPIWVVAELLGDDVRPVTLELLGRAVELASQSATNVEAVLVGDNVERHAPALTAYGADCVHVASEPRLRQYDTELYTATLAAAIRECCPYAVLVPSTANGRDLAARVAARLGIGLTGDCVGLDLDEEGRLLQLKPAFGGNIVAPILSKTTPQMATVRPGILTPVEPDYSVEPEVQRLPSTTLAEPRVRVLQSESDPSNEGVDLEHARRIVAVGMGIGGPENIGVIRELAETLDAALGATREVADAGWLPRQHQIGLSGKVVSPDLYIAVALRGPFNHTVGTRKAGTVVAINSSGRAPIFRAADFGIVGDYAEVVPALTSAIKRRQRS